MLADLIAADRPLRALGPVAALAIRRLGHRIEHLIARPTEQIIDHRFRAKCVRTILISP